MASRIVIIDDEKTFRLAAEAGLGAEGHEVRSATTGADGVALARAFGAEVVVLDRNLPDADGLAVLPRLLADGGADAPLVIMATAYGEVENAVQALKAGAFDYVTKPVQLPALLVTVEKALAARRLRRRAEGLSGATRRRIERGFCPGVSAAMRQVVELAEKVAASPDTTVLIEGESGTGKELIAHLVHVRTCGRRDAPFVELNCAAIPESLLESELFGHEKGAFTGASGERKGRFELAHGGTLFLDEVTEMPAELQVRLLRVLETGSLTRVGGSETLRVDVRVVAATNRRAEDAVTAGRLREDLLYRLNVFPILLPPLRERGDDVVRIASELAAKLARTMGKTVAPLGASDVAALRSYAWPGNVRELRNVVERAIITSRSGRLDLERVLPASGPSPQGGAPPAEGEILTERKLRQLERDNLVAALERAEWRISGEGGAADLLGLSPSTLKSRMKALEVRRPGGE